MLNNLIFYPHWTFNDALIDSIRNIFFDYSNGCAQISLCGMDLNPYGYYACAVTDEIDRVLGFDYGLPIPIL